MKVKAKQEAEEEMRRIIGGAPMRDL